MSEQDDLLTSAETAALSEQASQILVAVAEGKVDPETGKTLIACLQAVSGIRATEELEQRIVVLEMKQVA